MVFDMDSCCESSQLDAALKELENKQIDLKDSMCQALDMWYFSKIQVCVQSSLNKFYFINISTAFRFGLCDYSGQKYYKSSYNAPLDASENSKWK